MDVVLGVKGVAVWGRGKGEDERGEEEKRRRKMVDFLGYGW